jgi:PST family polysaccharide transporter
MTLILLLSAPLIGKFYGNPSVVEIFMISSLSILVKSFTGVDTNLLVRDMRFGALAAMEISAQIVASAAAIGLALLGAGALALALRTVVEALHNLLWLTVMRRWHLRFRLRCEAVRELWTFSGPLFGARLLGYLSRNADNIVVSRMLGDTALGLYNIAYRLLFKPFQGLGQVTFLVFFSGFSKLGKDPQRFAAAYLRVAGIYCVALFPMGLVMLVVPLELIMVLAGEAWLPAAPVVRVFGAVALLQAIVSPIGHIWLGLGRTDMYLKWNLIVTPVHITAFVVGATQGLVEVAVLYFLAELLLLYPRLAGALKLLDLRVRDLMHRIRYTLLASVIATGVGFVLAWTMKPILSSWLVLCLAGGSTLIVFGMIAWCFDGPLRKDLSEVLRRQGSATNTLQAA